MVLAKFVVACAGFLCTVCSLFPEVDEGCRHKQAEIYFGLCAPSSMQLVQLAAVDQCAQRMG